MNNTTLTDICEPLFLHVCCLNRMARHKGGQLSDFARVREETRNILHQIQLRAAEQGLSEQMSRVRLPLIYFVDSMIGQGGLPYASRWQTERLAPVGPGEDAGDTRFFELLEETLDEETPDADDRLEVFYTCLALGFEGVYRQDPQALNDLIHRVGERLVDRMDPDKNAPYCPEAYKFTDQRDLHQSAMGPVGVIALCSVFLVIIAFAFNGMLYADKTEILRRHVQTSPGKIEPVAPLASH